MQVHKSNNMTLGLLKEKRAIGSERVKPLVLVKNICPKKHRINRLMKASTSSTIGMKRVVVKEPVVIMPWYDYEWAFTSIANHFILK